MTVAGKMVQLDDEISMSKRRNQIEVWVAFGIGLFLGGFFGVFAMGLLFMTRGE